MNRRRLAVAASIAAAAAAISGIAWTAQATPEKKLAAAAKPGSPAVILADTREVQTAPREEITGNLLPAKALQLGFEVSGRLARILVKKGAFVEEGKLIAQLDVEMADAQVLQAEAAVRAAEAQAAMATDVAERNAQLLKSGSVSEMQNRTSGSSAAAATAQLQAARAQLAQARTTRKRHDLRAPFSGVLIDAPDQVGAAIPPNTTLFTLEQLDPLVLKVTVPENARSAIKPGARVHVDAIGGGARTDEALVRAVIPSADTATRRIPLEITVPNRDGRFTAHTLARAVVPLGAPETAISLPASALASNGGDHVFVVGAGGELRRVPVQVIDRGAERVVVKAQESLARVVDYPGADFVDGVKVSIR